MSPRLPRVTAAELLLALQRAGWRVRRQQGSHLHLIHPAEPGRATIPLHTGKTIPVAVLKSILDQTGLSAEELGEPL